MSPVRGGSVNDWIDCLRIGDGDDARRLRERRSHAPVRLGRVDLRARPRGAGDEEVAVRVDCALRSVERKLEKRIRLPWTAGGTSS